VANNTAVGILYGARISATANTASAQAIGLDVTAASTSGTKLAAAFRGAPVSITDSTPSTVTSNGALVVTGGIGVGDTSVFGRSITVGGSSPASGFGQLSVVNNAGAAINNYTLGSTYGGTTFGGVTGNNQAVIEASSAASSLYLGTGGGTSIVLAPNRTAALTLDASAATFARSVTVLPTVRTNGTWNKSLTFFPVDAVRRVQVYSQATTGNTVGIKWVKDINGTETDMWSVNDLAAVGAVVGTLSGTLNATGTGTHTFGATNQVSQNVLIGASNVSNGAALYAGLSQQLNYGYGILGFNITGTPGSDSYTSPKSTTGGSAIEFQGTNGVMRFLYHTGATTGGNTVAVTEAARFSNGNLSVNGTGGVQLNSVANLTWGGAYGAGIPAIAVPSAGKLGFYPNGSTSGLIGEFSSTGLAVTGEVSLSSTTDNPFRVTQSRAVYNPQLASFLNSTALYGASTQAGPYITFGVAQTANNAGQLMFGNYGGLGSASNTVFLSLYGATHGLIVDGAGTAKLSATTPSTNGSSGALIVAGGVGIGGIVNAANYRATGANGGPATQTTILDHSSGDGRVIVYGPDTATAGSFSMIGLSSNGSVGGSRFTISPTGAAAFAGTLTTSAGRVVATSIKTTTYTVTTSDYVLVGNHASTPFTITMIAASSNTGRQFIIKNKGAATVTVDATSLGTIDGSNSITLSTNQSTTLVSDGAQWNRI
jgi:hypothetical protein